MVYKCPVCKGRGFVPINFYGDLSNNLTDAITKCRTCEGSGVLWEKDNIPITITTYLPMNDTASNKPYNPCDSCSVRQKPSWNGICHCTLGGRGQITW